MKQSALTTSKLTELTSQVHDYELELNVLKTVVVRKENLKYFDILEEDDFYNNEYRALFIVLKNEYLTGKSLDLNLMPAPIKQMEVYHSMIMAADLTNYYIQEYINTLKKYTQKREIQRITYDLAVKVKEGKDPFEIMQYGIEKLNKYQAAPDEDIQSQNIRINNDLWEELQSDTFYGVKSGYPTLDYMIRGFANSTLTVLGGLPTAGKTTMALNMIVNICRTGKRVLYANMEMNYKSLRMKFVSIMTGLPAGLVYAEKKNITENQWNLISKALGETANFKLLSMGEGRVNIPLIEKRIKEHGGFDIVIIDHLQILDPPKSNNRYEEVMNISRNLKRLTTTYDMPVLAISSMTEEKGVPTKHPKLNALRDAHTIGYDADSVLFLTREAGSKDYDEKEFLGTQEEYEHHAELLVSKNRFGVSNKKINLYFDGALSIFKEVYKEEEYKQGGF